MMKEPAAFRVVDASFSAAAAEPANFPPPIGVEVAFAGRSNVGKSSLLNALMSRKNLVRTSSTPGCTRQVSFFKARGNDGSVLTLVDLPGYGYAKRSKSELVSWKRLIEAYLFERVTLAGVALLVDARRGIEKLDQELISALAGRKNSFGQELPILLVATKLDKVPSAQKASALATMRAQTSLPVSGFTTREPKLAEELWATVRKELGLITT